MPAEGALRDRLGPGDRLIETLGWLPGQGAVRAAAHRARMERSARALGIAFRPEDFDAALASVVTSDTPLRVRVTLAFDGVIETTAAPFRPLPEDSVWRVVFARTTLDAEDALLAHKTSHRGSYEAARAEFAAESAEEVIMLNQRGEVCEGTITNLFADFGDGVLVTPHAQCGLLPGVLRATLLSSDRAIEGVLKPDDLRAAWALYVGNSLRGLIRARLVE